MTHWRETFQQTIDCYPNDPDAGMEACERLLSTPALLPWQFELATRRNQTWYLPYLLDNDQQPFPRPRAEDDRSRFLVPRREGFSRQIEFAVPDGWSRFNPSIAAGPDGELRIIVRSSNYTVGPDMIYHFHETGDLIETTNYLGRVHAADLLVDQVRPIADRHLLNLPPPFPVSGFEDCRLFWHDGWKFSATLRDRSEHGVCHMAMCSLDGNRADDLVILSPSRRRHEKNWMPVANPHADRLQFVYTCDPMLVLVADRKGSLPNLWRRSPYIAREFRGGSQLAWVPSPFAKSSGLLALVHEAVNFDEPPRRIYQHRFVWWNGNLDIERISRPFCFHHRGLEFAAGMVRSGDDLIISYGIGDKEAWLMKVPLSRVLDLLLPPLPED